MANLKFKQNGLRILESKDGDLLIVDPSLDMELMFTSDFLLSAEVSIEKQEILAQKMIRFLKNHELARWSRAGKNMAMIEIEDPAFVEKLKDCLEGKQPMGRLQLRRIEKEIYYWMKSKGKLQTNQDSDAKNDPGAN